MSDRIRPWHNMISPKLDEIILSQTTCDILMACAILNILSQTACDILMACDILKVPTLRMRFDKLS